MSDDPNVSAVWRDARGSLDVLFEHTCCYDREEFNAVIESVRAEERERIAREVCDLAARRAGQYGLDLGLYEAFGIDPTTTREGA